jgi:predicted lipoprotein with Yx(FWY)xxD motif
MAKLENCVVRAQIMAMEHTIATTLKKAMILEDQITMALFTMHEDQLQNSKTQDYFTTEYNCFKS